MLALSACGGGATSPTPTGPATPPTVFSLTGTISNSATGAPISGATARVADGPNANQSATTNSGGVYTFPNLALGGFTVNFSATNYITTAQSITLTSNSRLDARLNPTPLFTRSGVGDNVFDIPTTVSRIRIQGVSAGNRCSNFVVRIAGRLIVNVIIGNCSIADSLTHDGTYVTNGGVTEVTISSGVSWTFTEVRQ